MVFHEELSIRNVGLSPPTRVSSDGVCGYQLALNISLMKESVGSLVINEKPS